MQRTGRNANMLSNPSIGRNSACLNLSELQRGHSRLIQSICGTHVGHVRLEKFISISPRATPQVLLPGHTIRTGIRVQPCEQ
jgi:hypothetical protein